MINKTQTLDPMDPSSGEVISNNRLSPKILLWIAVFFLMLVIISGEAGYLLSRVIQ